MSQSLSFGGAETLLAQALASALATATGGPYTDAQVISKISAAFVTALQA